MSDSGELILGHPDCYSFLFDAAREARKESQRYWAANDKRFPIADDMAAIWPLNEPPPPMRVSGRVWIQRGKAGDGA